MSWGHYVDCVVTLCVSLCQRPSNGGPEGVVLHFRSFINLPFAPTLFGRPDGMEGEERRRRLVNEFRGGLRELITHFIVALGLIFRNFRISAPK